MRNQEDIERLLAQVQAPSLREGPHREQLKAQLLDTAGLRGRKAEPLRPPRRFGTARLMKLAAGLMIAAALVATGWTAEKVYESIVKKDFYVELDKFEEPPITLPDGSTMMTASLVGTYIPEDAPLGSAETARRQYEEMKQLVGQKKYELVKTFEMPPGRSHYVYRFTLASGERREFGFFIPLENVASWDDYRRKSREHEKQRYEKIFKAFAADRFRLLDIEPISVHVCRDVRSKREVLVQRVITPGEQDVALVYGGNVTRHKTTWEEHLKTVRQGRRELLDLQVTKGYTYSVTLDDGSTTAYRIGSDCGARQLAERLRQCALVTAGEGR